MNFFFGKTTKLRLTNTRYIIHKSYKLGSRYCLTSTHETQASEGKGIKCPQQEKILDSYHPAVPRYTTFSSFLRVQTAD